jgi:hypothetical protein
MRGNAHVRFLGGLPAVRRGGYPTWAMLRIGGETREMWQPARRLNANVADSQSGDELGGAFEMDEQPFDLTAVEDGGEAFGALGAVAVGLITIFFEPV